MADQVELRCRCGEVRARVTDASPRTVNRIVCYCDDCQAFAHRLGRADLLNAQGGSDIVQLAPATLTFLQGQHRIAGLRLTPKGLFRWYASCCNTPVGNTLTPAIPFVGIVAQADRAARRPSARRPARSSASMRSARRRRARPASTCRCCCAPSARCSAGACAEKRGRTRSSRRAKASRSIRSRYCRRRSARRCARYADRIPAPRRRVERRYDSALIFSAAFGAKYVKIPSAPARLKPSRLSIIARSPSIQPLLAAPAIIAYSPDTW